MHAAMPQPKQQLGMHAFMHPSPMRMHSNHNEITMTWRWWADWHSRAFVAGGAASGSSRSRRHRTRTIQAILIIQSSTACQHNPWGDTTNTTKQPWWSTQQHDELGRCQPSLHPVAATRRACMSPPKPLPPPGMPSSFPSSHRRHAQQGSLERHGVPRCRFRIASFQKPGPAFRRWHLAGVQAAKVTIGADFDSAVCGHGPGGTISGKISAWHASSASVKLYRRWCTSMAGVS